MDLLATGHAIIGIRYIFFKPMMTRNCIESERFLLRVKIKGEPDVSTRAVARNIFRWAKTANRKTLPTRFGSRTVLSKNQFGAHDRRETVWRRAFEGLTQNSQLQGFGAAIAPKLSYSGNCIRNTFKSTSFVFAFRT